MKPKVMKQFAQEVLNTSGVREALRQRVAQIDRLESLDGLMDLKLTGLRVAENDLCIVDYQAIASRNLYPHIRANLIKQGVMSRGTALRSGTGNQGQSDEYESVEFGVSGSSIQVFLRAYNPNYRA